MSAIALLLPRLRRRLLPVPRSEPAPANEMPMARPLGCNWNSLAPALVLLGPVLHVDCLAAGSDLDLMEKAPWPARAELVGMACATRVVASVLIDSNGPRECLHFLAGNGLPLASIWLLPDSDFLAWERLVEQVPSMPVADVAWWQELPPHALRGNARVRRFSWIKLAGRDMIDALPPPRLSCIGQIRARQVAAAAGARLLDVFA